MTYYRQQYKEVAYILAHNNASEGLINSFITMFKEDNTLFNETKFKSFINRIKTEGE